VEIFADRWPATCYPHEGSLAAYIVRGELVGRRLSRSPLLAVCIRQYSEPALVCPGHKGRSLGELAAAALRRCGGVRDRELPMMNM
jgi:hypothetical protein